MADYIVTVDIVLQVEAETEGEAKEIAEEQLSDFLRYYSVADLMKVELEG